MSRASQYRCAGSIHGRIWLRSFVWAAVRRHDRVTRELLRHAWQAGLGSADLG